jgi:DNA topoisomerase VI subunit A
MGESTSEMLQKSRESGKKRSFKDIFYNSRQSQPLKKQRQPSQQGKLLFTAV